MLETRNICCGVLENISFKLGNGGCLAVSGPSGSGKTTLLNAIAGARKYRGELLYYGKDIKTLTPWQRPFRYLNQRLYLFPYLTVEGNLRLAQYAAGQPDDKTSRREILARLDMEKLAGTYPDRISGGERQRAALARAIIGSPRLLLLDEPFSSLDWNLRERLWVLLSDLRRHFGFAVLLVSHEPAEIAALAESCLHIRQGRVVEG